MPKYEDSFSAAEKGEYYPTQYATAQPSTNPLPTVQLQPPPARAPSTTPKPAQGMFSTPAPTQKERVNDHIGAAPGEPTYDAVPIPGAYSRLNADISLPPAAHRWNALLFANMIEYQWMDISIRLIKTSI